MCPCLRLHQSGNNIFMQTVADAFNVDAIWYANKNENAGNDKMFHRFISKFCIII